MRRRTTHAARLRRALALPLIACATLAACDDDPEPADTTAPAGEEPTATRPADDEEESGSPAGEVDKPSGGPEDAEPPPKPPRDPDEAAVARTVRAYLLGLDAGDGERVCSLLADPGAVEQIELPRPRGNCAESLAASIGARDPRGLPVFEGLRLAGVRAIQIQDDSARARATTVTTFADREEPSIEDDIVYLTRIGAEWLIAKPSAAFYRAIGAGDVPPSVIAPPPDFDGR